MTDTSTPSSSTPSRSTSGTPGETAGGVSAERLERFDRAVEQIGHRTSGGDRTWARAGMAAMAIGVVLAVLAFFISTSQSDERDVISYGILASVGVCLVVAGAAVFVRCSLTEFLRFWMLRALLAEDERRERD